MIAAVCGLSGRCSLGRRGLHLRRALSGESDRAVCVHLRAPMHSRGRVTRGKRLAGADIDQRVFRGGDARAVTRESAASDHAGPWPPPNATTTSPSLWNLIHSPRCSHPSQSSWTRGSAKSAGADRSSSAQVVLLKRLPVSSRVSAPETLGVTTEAVAFRRWKRTSPIAWSQRRLDPRRIRHRSRSSSRCH